MDANEIMQAFDKQYGSAATLPTIALFAGIAIGVIGIIGLIVCLIGKGKTTGIGKFSAILAPIELILGIISMLAFGGVTVLILLVTNGILEPNELFYGFAFTPAKFGMPIGENGPIDTVVIITYAIVLALPALICIGAAIIGFIGKSKAKKIAAASVSAQPQFAMNAINGQPIPQPNMAQQPVPQPNIAQQPVPQPNMAQQPVPQPNIAQQPVPQPNIAQQPLTQPNMAQQPVSQPNIAQQPVPQPNIAQQPVPQPVITEQTAPKMDAVSCPVCGNEVEGNRSFCAKCGVKLALADEDDQIIPTSPVNEVSQPAPIETAQPVPMGAPINEAVQPAPEAAPAVEAAPAETASTTAPTENYNSLFDAPEPAPVEAVQPAPVAVPTKETAQPAPQSNPRFCVVCGNVLNETSAFCTRCGTPVNAQPAPEAVPAVEAVPAETASTTAPTENYNSLFDAPEPAPVAVPTKETAQPAPQSNTRFCVVCGNVLNETSAFCTKCGTPVNAQPAPEDAPAVEAAPAETASTTAPTENYNSLFDAPEPAPVEAVQPVPVAVPTNETAQPIPQSNTRFCVVCGNVLNETSAFCTKCGTPVNAQPAVEAVPAETASTTAPVEAVQPVPVAVPTNETAQPAPQSNPRFCVVCGNVLNETSAFCTKCGTPVNAQPAVEAVPAETASTTAPVEAVQPVPVTVPTNETAQPIPQSNTRFCVVCGNVLNETSAFCTKCGTPVNAQPAVEAAAVTASTTAPIEAVQPMPVEAVQPVPVAVPTSETAQPVPQSNTHFCVVCGNVLNETSAFCTRCGTPVNAQPAPEAAPAVEAVPAETASTTAPVEAVQPTPVEAVQPVPVAVPTNETAQPVPQSNTRFCVVCGNVLNETSAFCTKCGTPVNAQPAPQSNTRFCVVCGNVLNETSAFCTKCGTPVTSADSSIACPCCGTKLTKETKFCVKCGTKIQ